MSTGQMEAVYTVNKEDIHAQEHVTGSLRPRAGALRLGLGVNLLSEFIAVEGAGTERWGYGNLSLID